MHSSQGGTRDTPLRLGNSHSIWGASRPLRRFVNSLDFEATGKQAVRGCAVDENRAGAEETSLAAAFVSSGMFSVRNIADAFVRLSSLSLHSCNYPLQPQSLQREIAGGTSTGMLPCKKEKTGCTRTESDVKCCVVSALRYPMLA